MPIDPQTGLYVNPIGNISPGGGGTAALQILSNMLASQEAQRNQGMLDIEAQQKQHEYQRQLSYEHDMENASTPDAQENVASRYAPPSAVLSNMYRHDYQTQLNNDRNAKLEEKKASDRANEETNLDKAMQAAGWTWGQAAQEKVRRGFLKPDDANIILNSDRAGQPFSAATEAKIGLAGARSDEATSRGNYLDEKAETESQLRDLKKKMYMAQYGLDNARAEQLYQAAQVLAAKPRGSVGQPTIKQLTDERDRLQDKVNKAKLIVSAGNLAGGVRIPIGPEEKAVQEEAIRDYQAKIDKISAAIGQMPVASPTNPAGSQAPPIPTDGGHSTGLANSWDEYVKKKASGQ